MVVYYIKYFIYIFLRTYMWMIFAYALLSWFNGMNGVKSWLSQLIEPVVEPIGRLLPRALQPFRLMILYFIILMILEML